MKQGIRRDQIDAMEKDIETADLDADKRQTVEEELEATRERQDDLRKQIDQLRNRLAESQKSIGLDEEHFRSAISCALELMGAEPLKSVDGAGDGPPRCRFPAIDQQEGADPTWADTMDTLRARPPRDQKFWEWRKTSPIRPVVFEDTGTMDDAGRAPAPGTTGRPAVARPVHRPGLCPSRPLPGVPGPDLRRDPPRGAVGASLPLRRGRRRLHEELIPVTARWTDPKIRKGQLSPYARDAETRTMDLLEEAILLKGGQSVTDAVLKQLQACAPARRAGTPPAPYDPWRRIR